MSKISMISNLTMLELYQFCFEKYSALLQISILIMFLNNFVLG